MKHFTLKSLLTLLVIVSSVTVVQAYDFEVDGIAYNVIAEGECKVASRNGGYTGDIFIPGSVVYEGVNYKVTAIGDFAFSGCSFLTSVSLPAGLTTIGYGAFYDCTSLTSVSFPAGLIDIGFAAFYDCSSLTSVSFSDGLAAIGEWAFRYCSSLTSVSFSDGLATIGECAFRDCSSLTSVSFSDGLTTIGYGAFYDCSSLISISLPDGLTTIGGRAFYDCSSLTSIFLPKSLTEIGGSAFYNCSSLPSITLPGSLNKIGAYAFAECSALRNVVSYAVVPPEIVNEYAFDAATYAEATLTIPEGSEYDYSIAYGWSRFMNMMSGIDDVQSDALSLTTDGMTVTVNGVDEGTAIRVWDMSGRLVYDGADSCITLPAHGIYVITAGGRTAKVSL